jgi:DNA-nicking Smr family endonuclease
MLDLHGSREKEAFEQLQNFIITNYNQGKRCLLVITGKGKNSEVWWESKGVLRQALPNWLNNPEIRPYILAVANAKQEDGGSGAFYCLLKRKR